MNKKLHPIFSGLVLGHCWTALFMCFEPAAIDVVFALLMGSALGITLSALYRETYK